MTIENTIKEYRKAVKAAGKTLEALQESAAELADNAGEREQAQARLAFLEEHSTGLMSKRESLKRRYSEADFEGDAEQLEIIRNLRTRLDQEIEAVEKEELLLQEKLKNNPVDASALADVYVKAQLVSLPEHKQVLAEIETLLKAEEKAIHGSVEDIHATLPRTHLKGAHIEAARLGHDTKHAAKQRAYERHNRLAAEGTADYLRSIGMPRGDFKNTDEVHAARGERRSVHPGAMEDEEELVLSR